MHTSDPTRKPDTLLQEAGEETPLYSPVCGAVYILNPRRASSESDATTNTPSLRSRWNRARVLSLRLSTT
jgi:hypothetical protein